MKTLGAHAPIIPAFATVISSLLQGILLRQIVDADVLKLLAGSGYGSAQLPGTNHILACSVGPASFVEALANLAKDILGIDPEMRGAIDSGNS